MRTYASSRVKRNSFYRKSELQFFLLISGGYIGAPKRCTNIMQYGVFIQGSDKGAWNVSANNSETVGHKDLRLGQIVYILAFYHHNISFSWLKGNKREETFREHYTPNLTAGSVVRCQIKNGGCCGQKKTRFKCSARGKWPAENNSIVSDGTLVLPNHNSVVVWSQ